MGLILDVVPNHMSIAGQGNRWWWDVLENGQSSRYASYFDVDWHPPEAKLHDTVLMPILGDHYGVEPRHLRMYRAFVDREVALFEQVLLPFRRRRNPSAQERGEATLRELAHLGRRLRTALLRQAVRRSPGI